MVDNKPGLSDTPKPPPVVPAEPDASAARRAASAVAKGVGGGVEALQRKAGQLVDAVKEAPGHVKETLLGAPEKAKDALKAAPGKIKEELTERPLANTTRVSVKMLEKATHTQLPAGVGDDLVETAKGIEPLLRANAETTLRRSAGTAGQVKNKVVEVAKEKLEEVKSKLDTIARDERGGTL